MGLWWGGACSVQMQRAAPHILYHRMGNCNVRRDCPAYLN